jgi:hypothetical protein
VTWRRLYAWSVCCALEGGLVNSAHPEVVFAPNTNQRPRRRAGTAYWRARDPQDQRAVSNDGRACVMKRRSATTAVIVAAAALAACPMLLSGCAPQVIERAKVPPAEPSQAQPTQSPQSRPATAMPYERRKSRLPTTFPIEVPVPDGDIVSVTEQDEGSSGAWSYDLASGSDAAELGAWYVRAYAAANWALTEDTRDSEGVGTLVFRKGDAQAVVRLSPSDEGTNVHADIGVGIPVADTM